MNFWLKKTIELFLLPLPIGIFLILIGVCLWILFPSSRISVFFHAVGLSIVIVFSLKGVSNLLISHLQSQYSPLLVMPNNVTQVVVLGGGVGSKKNYPPNLTLSAPSLSRLVEGIRIFKALQKNHINAQLILSGGRIYRSPTAAGIMQNTAVMLDVAPKDMVLEAGSKDTHQEALFLKKRLREKPFILVTSGYHMPRAMALFEGLNMRPIAAPTQLFTGHTTCSSWLIPDADALVDSDTAIHEYLGILWAKWRGYIK